MKRVFLKMKARLRHLENNFTGFLKMCNISSRKTPEKEMSENVRKQCLR